MTKKIDQTVYLTKEREEVFRLFREGYAVYQQKMAVFHLFLDKAKNGLLNETEQMEFDRLSDELDQLLQECDRLNWRLYRMGYYENEKEFKKHQLHPLFLNFKRDVERELDKQKKAQKTLEQLEKTEELLTLMERFHDDLALYSEGQRRIDEAEKKSAEFQKRYEKYEKRNYFIAYGGVIGIILLLALRAFS